MSELKDEDVQAVDRLVRNYLDRQTEQTDATALLDRIHASRPQAVDAEPPATASVFVRRPASRRGPRSLLWPALTALAVFAAFFGGRYFGAEPANAAFVLRDVRAEHSRAVDHCYRVQYAPDPRTWNRANRLEGPSQSVLWTRGDRFWSECAIGEVELSIGREDDGTLWVSPARNKGIRFTNDESQLPAEVAFLCAVNSMSVPKLMNDVLADFDLRAEKPADSSGDTRTVVWATLKPGRSHPLLSDALLEIDDERNVLVRMVLWTVRDGRPKGTVTFTLLESSKLDDEQYRMTSHIDADATIERHTISPSKDVQPDERD